MVSTISIIIVGELPGVDSEILAVLTKAGIDLLPPHVSDRDADVVVVLGAVHHETKLPKLLIVEPGRLFAAVKLGAAGVLTTEELGLLPETVALAAQGLRVCHGPTALFDLLGDEKLQLLRLLCKGVGDRQIGLTIGYSRRQVQRQVQELFGLLGVRSRGEALLVAGRVGFSPHDLAIP